MHACAAARGGGLISDPDSPAGGPPPPAGHAFTSVDEQAEPRAWIHVLDRLAAEPFYRAYKERLGDLLRPVAGGRYLEVGTGTGADALALERRFDVSVAGADASETMVTEARRRGLADGVVADAHALPFEDGTFDGAWADRTFQHLDNPKVALGELARVTQPGGRVVTADPDYDTLVVAVRDQELARRVVRYRADHLLRNGSLAHRMVGLFAGAGLRDVTVEAMTLAVRDPTAVDNVMGLRSWVAHGAEQGFFTADEAGAWERSFDEAVAAGEFLFAVTFFLTAGVR